MGRLLGIDPGVRRVGLALTDETGTLATPLRIVDRDEESLSGVLEELLAERDVELLVVGYPDPLKTDENERTRQVDRFLRTEVEPLGIAYETISERYTTSMAETLRRLREDPEAAGDDQAAALILEQFLNRRRMNDS